MPRTHRTLPKWLAPTLAVLGVSAIANLVAQRRAERRTPPVGRLVHVGGETVHVVERGSGAHTVVLIHGNGSLAQDWLISGVVERLAATHRVVIVERPGFGYSTRSRTRLWSPQNQARLLRGALDAVGVDRATIVGHSWGTLVAVAHALLFPEQTAAVGLLSGYYVWTFRPDAILNSGPAIPVAGDVLRYTFAPVQGFALTPLAFKAVFAPAPVPPRFAAEMPVGLMLRPSQLRAVAEDNLILGPGADSLKVRYEDLARFPLLLLNGDGDKIVGPDTHTGRLAAVLPSAEHVVLPGIGHMVHHSEPAAVADAILRLTARAEAASTADPAPYRAPLAA